jgi:hypothetical protein
MQPNSDGRFCEHCKKSVIDFSQMSDNEIAFYLHLHRGENLCGRVKATQNEKKYAFIQTQRTDSPVKRYVMAIMAGLLVALPSQANAQDKPSVKIESVIDKSQNLSKENLVDKNSLALRLIDKETGKPLTFVEVTARLNNSELNEINNRIIQIKTSLHFLEKYEDLLLQLELEKDEAKQVDIEDELELIKLKITHYNSAGEVEIGQKFKAILELKLEEAREIKKRIKARLKVPTNYTVYGVTDTNGYVLIPLSDDMPQTELLLSFRFLQQRFRNSKGEIELYYLREIHEELKMSYMGGQQSEERSLAVFLKDTRKYTNYLIGSVNRASGYIYFDSE